MESHGFASAKPVCSTAINDMAIEKLKQTKAGCLVIRATEEEVEKIALSNPDLFVEADVIHEKY